MAGKHTQGKWIVNYDENIGVEICSGERTICLIYPDVDLKGRDGYDARLIAAAPALLEAAKIGLSMATEMESIEIERLRIFQPMTDSFHKDVKFIEAAIKLAEPE